MVSQENISYIPIFKIPLSAERATGIIRRLESLDLQGFFSVGSLRVLER